MNAQYSKRLFVKYWRVFISLLVLLAIPACQDVGLAEVSSPSTVNGASDFVEYWGASRLLLTGGNPYSPTELLLIQKSIGRSGTEPLVMWNPPWTLSLILPFGLVDYTTGQFFWLLAQVSCVLAAARISWSISGRGTRGNWIPWLLGLTFIPTGLVLILGQITPLILFALSALLYFERKESWFALGASITVLSIKPHLIYLFWVVLVLWIWQRKRWRVVLGAVASGVCIALIPLLLDPQVYSEYFALYQYQGITKPMEWSAPTLGNVFKILFHFESNGPQAIFSMFAVAWVLGYWRRYKDSWLWSEHLPLLILVSVTTNFFVWTYDQVVFVLAIIQRATWLEGRRWGWYDCIGVTSYVLINLIYLIGKCFVINDAPYFWLAPAFMTSYLLLKHGANLSKTI